MKNGECQNVPCKDNAFQREFNWMNAGKLIKNPNAVFRAVYNGKKMNIDSWTRGSFEAGVDEFSRMVYMDKHFNLDETEKYIEKNDVQIEVFLLPHCKLQKRVVKLKSTHDFEEI